MKNQEHQHVTLTEQEMFRNALLTAMHKACVQPQLNYKGKIPVRDTTWSMGRKGAMFRETEQEVRLCWDAARCKL